MESETNDYDVKPINHKCTSSMNSYLTKPNPNSTNYNVSTNLNSVSNQHKLDSQYDNVDNLNVKPMYGGKNIFKIKFRNKYYNISGTNELDAIKIFLNGRIFKKDHLIEISYNNIDSLYIIRRKYKNKIIRLN